MEALIPSFFFLDPGYVFWFSLTDTEMTLPMPGRHGKFYLVSFVGYCHVLLVINVSCRDIYVA